MKGWHPSEEATQGWHPSRLTFTFERLTLIRGDNHFLTLDFHSGKHASEPMIFIGVDIYWHPSELTSTGGTKNQSKIDVSFKWLIRSLASVLYSNRGGGGSGSIPSRPWPSGQCFVLTQPDFFFFYSFLQHFESLFFFPLENCVVEKSFLIIQESFLIPLLVILPSSLVMFFSMLATQEAQVMPLMVTKHFSNSPASSTFLRKRTTLLLMSTALAERASPDGPEWFPTALVSLGPSGTDHYNVFCITLLYFLPWLGPFLWEI